jgi:hypothetical protein
LLAELVAIGLLAARRGDRVVSLGGWPPDDRESAQAALDGEVPS